MKTKVSNWEKKVAMSDIAPWKKRLSFERQLLPKIRYLLSAIHLSEKDCDSIFDPLLPHLKDMYGCYRTYFTDLLHLPKTFGGHGIPNLFLLHISSRIKLMMSNLHHMTSCGGNLKILLDTQQLEAGVRQSILRPGMVTTRKYIIPSWLTHLITALASFGFHLKYDNWLPEPSQQTIMDIVNQFSLPLPTIKIFNKVRLSLQLLYLSDAYTLSGNSLLPFLNVGLVARRSRLHWPSRNVSRKEMETFMNILSTMLPKSIRPSVCSSHPPLTIVNYTTEDGRKVEYKGRVNPDRKVIYQADIIIEEGIYKVVDIGLTTTFVPFKQSTVFTPTITQEDMINSFKHGCMKAGSDGSARLHSSSSATWFGDESDPFLIGRPVHGPSHDSFRAEIDGVLHLLELFVPIQDHLPHQSISFSLDNKSVVNLANDSTFAITPASIDKPFAPQRIALSHLLNQLSHQINFTHVPSHQDDEKSFEELSAVAKNNVRCDDLAKAISNDQPSLELPTRMPPGLKICLASQQGLILDNIYHHLSSSLYMDHVQSHLSVSPQDLWRIDWKLHGEILRKVRPQDDHLVKKIIWRKNYTLLEQHRHGTHDSPHCPLCGRDEEKLHFIRCEKILQSKSAVKAYNQLRQDMSELNISPIFWQVIVACLEDRPLPFSGEAPLDSRLIEIYGKQKTLSQEQFLFGRLMGDFFFLATYIQDVRKKNSLALDVQKYGHRY